MCEIYPIIVRGYKPLTTIIYLETAAQLSHNYTYYRGYSITMENLRYLPRKKMLHRTNFSIDSKRLKY